MPLPHTLLKPAPGRLISLCLVSMLGTLFQPALAVSSAQVVDAIQKAQIITTPVSAKVESGTVTLSTFLNKKSNDQSLKVNALLIAKQIMDLCPDDIGRVNIFFYNTTLTKYRSLTISAGDVKAFGSGALNQEQLLSSLQVQDGKVSDANSKMDAFLESSKELRKDQSIHSKVNGPVLEITAQLEPWASSARDLKLEALHLSDKALEVASPSIQKIQVNFIDPSNPKKMRQVETEVSNLTSIHNGIETLLEPIAITEINNESTAGMMSAPSSKGFETERLSVETLDAVPGFAQEDRKRILERIKDLTKAGVGTEHFVDSFLSMEEDAKNGDDDRVKEDIEQLTKLLDAQDQRRKDAQEFVPDKGKNQAAQKPAPAPEPAKPVQIGDVAYDPYIQKVILNNPASAMAYYKLRWQKDKKHKPADYPNYLHLLDFFGKTLRSANRPDEASVYEKEAAAIRAKTDKGAAGETEK